MNRIDKLYRILAVLMLASIVMFSTTTYAYMYSQTKVKKNEFHRAIVDCEVEDICTDNIKSIIKVKNTGNVAAYIRVRLVSYWIDDDENIVAKASVPVKINSLNPEKWIADADNDTYYYKEKIESESKTSDLLEKMDITLEQEDGYRQVVEVFAEAIQAEPDKAVEESWPVKVEEDTEGKKTIKKIIQVN